MLLKLDKNGKIPWYHLDEYYKIPNEDLLQLFKKLRSKYNEGINEIFGIEIKTHYKIASGNYSYFFLLPQTLNAIKRKYPYLSVSLKLAEFRNYDDLSKVDYECIFTSRPTGKYTRKEFLSQINKYGYDTYRGYIKDAGYFAASKEAVEEYGSKENTLDKMDLLCGRCYKNSTNKEEIKSSFQTMPECRKQEAVKIVSDYFFLSYLLMEESVGIWMNFDTMPVSDKVERLTKIPDSDTDRYAIFSGSEIINSKIATQMRKSIRKSKKITKR